MNPIRRPSPPPVIRADIGARLVALIGAGLVLAGLFAGVRIVTSDQLPGALEQIRIWR